MSATPTAIGELLRRHYPKAKGYIQALIEAMQNARTQGVKINDVDIINRVIPLRSKVRVEDEIDNAQLNISGGYPTYYPATEPNGTTVKLYLFMDHIAQTYRDYSGFNHDAELRFESGTPEVEADGPDLGNGFASRALKYKTDMNMVTVVKDSADIRIAGLTTGFSLTLRVRLDSLADIDGITSNRPRFYQKYDDANNSIMVVVDGSGKVEVHINRSGVTTRWETTNQEIFVDTWYTITIVYNITGPALTMYITEDGQAAGAAKSLVSGIGARAIFSETTDLLMGAYDTGAYGTFDGATSRSTADSAPLDLSTFTVAARFKTSMDNRPSSFTYIMAKGNYVTETAGQNMNYYIGQNNANRIVGGYEENNGTDHYVTSPLKYNDGKWHYVVITFDLSLLRMYIDGILVATIAATATPQVNALSLFIGSHQGPSNFWVGGIDEVRIWNTVLNQTDVTNLLTDNIQATGLVFEENFGGKGFHNFGTLEGNIQFVMLDRDVLYTAAQAQAIANNHWTTNPNVGSNKVAMSFYTLATTA